MKHAFLRAGSLLAVITLCIGLMACSKVENPPPEQTTGSQGTGTTIVSGETDSTDDAGTTPSQATTTKAPKPQPITDADDIPSVAPKYATFKNSSGNVMAKIDTVKGKTISLLCVDYAQFDPDGAVNVYLKKYYGVTVKQTRVANNNVPTEFTTAYLSGKPYDLVTDTQVFPQFVTQNVIEPVTNRVDFTIPVIAKYKSIFDAYSYAGYNFFLPWVYNPHALIYFNKEIFEDAHLDLDGDGKKGDDPYSLFKAGKWTWSVFKEAAKKTHRVSTTGEVKTYGLLARNWTDSKMVYISGQHLTKERNGKLVSNLGNSDFQTIFTEYVALLNDSKVAKRGDDAIYNTFNNGDAAMLYGPSYMTKGDYFSTIFAKQNVGLAPLPKYENSEAYNVPGICYGFWISKGGFKRNGKFDVDLLNAFLNAAILEEEERGQKGSEVYNMLRDEFVKKWSAKNRKFTNSWYDAYSDIQRSFFDATIPFVEPYDECINISQVLDVMTGWGDQPPGTFSAAVNQFEGELQKQLDDLEAYNP